jgi:5-methyltetrahydropteroyltriglutamate--homocysteine methyltransferase
MKSMNLPILPTMMVGSYAMPGFLERLKTDFFARRISRHDLDEIHDAAIKAAIKDQEIAGLDIITDGELRRDNMVDYFVERLPGVQIDRSSKKFYYDFYDSTVAGRLPVASLGLAQDFRFLQSFTERQPKICITGPHCLSKRNRNKVYPGEDMDLARVMNPELKALARIGADLIQIDEPYYSGFPEDLPWAVKALNALLRQAFLGGPLPVSVPHYSRSQDAAIDARVRAPGGEDLDLFKEFPSSFELGVGVIDVKNHDIEPPEMVAEHILKALNVMPAERIFVLADCGCFHLPRDVAFAKRKSMVEGTRIVRKELGK